MYGHVINPLKRLAIHGCFWLIGMVVMWECYCVFVYDFPLFLPNTCLVWNCVQWFHYLHTHTAVQDYIHAEGGS